MPCSAMNADSSATQRSTSPTTHVWGMRAPSRYHRVAASRLGEEPRVELAAIALGRAHGRPVALGIVGHEAGSDDADAIVGGIAAGRRQRLTPGIEHLVARPLRQEMAVEPRGAPGAAGGHRREPQRRSAGLHVARMDHDVVEIVARAVEAEALAREAATQHLEAFLGARHALRQRNAEAPELVGRVAHADADLDATATQVVEHRQVLGETHG